MRNSGFTADATARRALTAAVTLAAFVGTLLMPHDALAQSAPTPTPVATAPASEPPAAVQPPPPTAIQTPAWAQPAPPAYPQQPPPIAYPPPGYFQQAPPAGYPQQPPAAYPYQPGNYYYPPPQYAAPQYTPPQYAPQYVAPQAPPPSVYNPPALQFKQPRLHYEMKRRSGLLVAGLSLFLASYLSSAAGALLSDEGTLAIPVAGPIVLIARQNQRSSQCDDLAKTGFGTCYADATRVDPFTGTLMVVNSLVQVTGLILFFAGFSKTRVIVRDNLRVSIIPTASSTSTGVAAVGTF